MAVFIDALSRTTALGLSSWTSPDVLTERTCVIGVLVSSNNNLTLRFNWSNDGVVDILTESATILAGVAQENFRPIKAKYVNIELVNAGNNTSLVVQSFFFDLTGSALALRNLGSGVHIANLNKLGIRSAISGDNSITITNTEDVIDIRATGTVPNISAVNNDVQVTSVVGGYTLDIGSAPGRGVVKITNGTGDNLNAVNCVAIGGDAGFTSQGVVGGANGGAVAIGVAAGRNNQQQQAISIGRNAGLDNQRADSISIGVESGRTDQQAFSVAIGPNSGNFQQATQCVSIGNSAGRVAQGSGGICIGSESGRNSQASQAIAIGLQAGLGNPSAPFLQQGLNAIAIGALSGRYGQDSAAIAIGFQAAQGNILGTSIQPARSIAIGNNCETPGAVDRLAFRAENIIAPSGVIREATNALIPIQWNGVLYRIPALSLNASDRQITNIIAGSGITVSGSYPSFTISSSAVIPSSIYGSVNMLPDGAWAGYTFSITSAYTEITPSGATYSSSLGTSITNPSSTRLTYTGATTRNFMVTGTYGYPNSDDLGIAIGKNGVEISGSRMEHKASRLLYTSCIVSLATNDYVSVFGRRSGNQTANIQALGITLVAVN